MFLSKIEGPATVRVEMGMGEGGKMQAVCFHHSCARRLGQMLAGANYDELNTQGVVYDEDEFLERFKGARSNLRMLESY